MEEDSEPLQTEQSESIIRVNPWYWAIFIQKYWITAVMFVVTLVLLVLVFFGVVQLDFVFAVALTGLTFCLLATVLLHSFLHQVFTIYEIGKSSVVKRHGIINKKTISAPIEMITDLSLQRNVLDHLLGTATLLVNTAGSNDYAIYIKYVSLKNANFMNARIVELKKENRKISAKQ
jgi:uncharacterized membrane protein YdbT with pleckstrin-like domain